MCGSFILVCKMVNFGQIESLTLTTIHRKLITHQEVNIWWCTGLLLIWISTHSSVPIWHVNLAVLTYSVWKVIEGKIDMFWWVDMKLDRIKYTKHVLILLISIILHMLCEAKVAPFFKFTLGAERTKCKKWRLLLS